MIATEIRWALAALVILAAVFDWSRRRIPDWLTLPSVAAGFALQIWLGGFEGLKAAAGGIAVALAIYVPLFAIRAMGGGDVKLMAAVGAFLGPMNWLLVFLVTSLLGGVAALALAIGRGRLGGTLRNVGFIVAELAQGRAPHLKRERLDIRHPDALTMPHGVVIAAATLLFLR